MGHIQHLGDIADAHGFVAQQFQDLDTGGVAQNLKDLGHGLHIFVSKLRMYFSTVPAGITSDSFLLFVFSHGQGHPFFMAR